MLAADLGLSRNTVVAAYALLRSEGLVEAKGAAGTIVTFSAPSKAAVSRKAMVGKLSSLGDRLLSIDTRAFGQRVASTRYDLHYGEPIVNMALFTNWRSSLSHAMARTEGRYPDPQGLAELRREITTYLGSHRGISCDPDDLIVVNGTQQAMALIARVLINEGDGAVVENPHYEMTTNCLRAHGAIVTHVPVDREGMTLRDALHKSAEKLRV
jgi:GntR family transcriptional regulator / MocR family aminotransferase